MGLERTAQALGKMVPGTFGGRSKTATPVARRKPAQPRRRVCFHLFDHLDDDRAWFASALSSTSITVLPPPNGGPGDLLYVTGFYSLYAGAPPTLSTGWTGTFDFGTTVAGGFWAIRTRDGTADDTLTVTFPTSVTTSRAESYSIATDPAQFLIATGGGGVDSSITWTSDPLTAAPFDPTRGYIWTIFDVGTSVSGSTGVDLFLTRTVGTEHTNDLTFDGDQSSVTVTAATFDGSHYISGWRVASFPRCLH